jgi:Fe-S-cluster containining protein
VANELSADFKFCLRREIRIDETALHDSLTGSVYSLDAIGRAVLDSLPAHLPNEELVNRVTGVCGASRAKVERELRQMILLGLFEGTCSHYRERLERVRDGERLTVRVLEGSRFGCQNSGACCRGYVFGSIPEEEKHRIEALNPRDSLPHLGDYPLFIEAGLSSGKPIYRLGTVGDACVFLEEGPRCGLHRAFGADAKPTLCQLYPLAAVATIEGLKLYDRGECATFAISARSGALLQEDIPRLRALLDESIYHPMVHLHGLWRCDYGLILALASRLQQEVNSHSPLQALHTVGHVARGFVVALTQCPFESGQPEATAKSALDGSAEAVRPSQASLKANARAGLQTMGILAAGLAERVLPNEPLAPPFREAASLLAEICRNALGAGPLCERTRAAIAISMENDCEQAIRLSLRQQLFGRELLLDDRLPAGLLRMAFVIVLTLVGARLRALDDGHATVLPRHLSTSHMVAKRMLHRPEPHAVLRVNGEQSWCILDALPLLTKDLGFTCANARFPQV